MFTDFYLQRQRSAGPMFARCTLNLETPHTALTLLFYAE